MTPARSDLAPARERAVASCLDDVRAILGDAGVDRAALERVKSRLLALASRRDLFTFAQFPLRHERSTMHVLAEDDGDGLALYAVAAQGESATPPHDHTTWAVVVGIEGEEMNKLWRRVDDGASPGNAELEQIEETLVAPGTGVALMPEDIHSIHRASDAPLLHFHLYGRSIERLPERKQFDLARGTYEVYPASPNIQR
jgi:predicted metal-dependent enzyme (double-stranded beta helix superfamily)